MTQNLTTQTQQRLPTIAAALLQGQTTQAIANTMGVARETISRDMSAWLRSGGFEDWLKAEWLRLHQQILQSHPELAYVQASRLLTKLLVERVELDATVREFSISASWTNKAKVALPVDEEQNGPP